DGTTSSTDQALSPGGLQIDLVGFQAAWTDVGASWARGQGIALTSVNGITDVIVQKDRQLVDKMGSDGSWMPPENQYDVIVSGAESAPSAVSFQGNFDIVYRAAAGNVMHLYSNGKGLQTEDLGGSTVGTPTISVAPDGSRMDVFARVGNQVW